jgi:predicted nucleic acid-binding protein
MILIDTSAWIDFFRGREPLASAVDEALESDDAALCGPVLTELRRGLLNERERRRVLPLLDALHVLSPPDQLWADAGDLGFALRRRGVISKTIDLLIATYALTHAAALLTADADFAAMQKAGVPLQLARR